MMKTINLKTQQKDIFLFRAIQEISEELTKSKERFFIDLGDMVRNVFDDQTLFYWKEKGYYDFDTNTLNINSGSEDLYYLDLAIEEHKNLSHILKKQKLIYQCYM